MYHFELVANTTNWQLNKMFSCTHFKGVFVMFICYTKHFKQFHGIMPGFLVTYKIDDCRDSFTTVRYFVRNVNRKQQKSFYGLC